MERLVVVGGAGFLGRSLVSAISAHGDRKVHCFDRVPFSSFAPLPPNVEEVVGDATNAALLEQCIRGADCVWIRAGVLGGANSTRIERAGEYVNGNIDLTRAVILACENAGCSRVIFDSTEQVWCKSGDLSELGTDKEPMAPNFYGASKLVSEKLLRWWASQSRERSVQVFRYSRVRAAQTRDVLHFMVKAALAGEPIRIIGNPAHRISFVHAQDVLNANMLALGLRPNFVTYQLSCDRPYSLWELAQLVMAVVGKTVPIKFEKGVLDSPSFEPFVTGMAWEESTQELGTCPAFSVAEMIQETAKFLERNVEMAAFATSAG